MASLAPEGSNYPFLRYLIEQVTGQSFPDYMQQNIFDPLGMTNSGFNAEEFPGRHAIPYTRIDGENIELPVWNGNGYMMLTLMRSWAAARTISPPGMISI